MKVRFDYTFQAGAFPSEKLIHQARSTLDSLEFEEAGFTYQWHLSRDVGYLEMAGPAEDIITALMDCLPVLAWGV